MFSCYAKKMYIFNSCLKSIPNFNLNPLLGTIRIIIEYKGVKLTWA